MTDLREQVARAIMDWVRDKAPIAIKMRIEPAHVSELTDAAIAVCAAFVEAHGREDHPAMMDPHVCRDLAAAMLAKRAKVPT